VSIPTPPFNELLDVTAPVQGTPTHVPNEQTRLEVDVRVGNPDDPTYNFPLIPAFEGTPSTGANDQDLRAKSNKNQVRVLQALKLAKLRIAAGLERDDEIAVTGSIESGSLTDELIAHEISTLEKVVGMHKAAQARTLAAKSAKGNTRAVPSLAPEGPRPRLSIEDVDIFL
jgi:hypothetical protein